MRDLLKLSLTALTVLVLAGCGGGNGDDEDKGIGDITGFLSDFPSLDTSGHNVTFESKEVVYEDKFSFKLAAEFNTEIGNKGFKVNNSTIYHNTSGSIGFYSDYILPDTTSADRNLNKGNIQITSWYGENRSYIQMVLEANRSIADNEFVDVFGKIDAGLLTKANTVTIYTGNLTAEFDDYYIKINGNGELFSATGRANSNRSCSSSATNWNCNGTDSGGVSYRFDLNFNGTDSKVTFSKRL
jgi:hypothetical protein